MASEQGVGLLTLYSDVKASPVRWLWYPYIAEGKITLLQGDPGDGKSTMMMHFIAELSKGGATPDGQSFGRPYRIIYQCSEDNAEDTIKPRLESCGADCLNIAFINEEIHDGLTLDDERIRQAIMYFKPKLVVIDPIQSYIGSDSDLQIAVRARKLMRRIGLWASEYNCAIVLIGHLTKNEGTRALYRSLGSIDVVASARSVLQVERDAADPDIRVVRQIKNSIAAPGADIRFRIDAEGFEWLTGKSGEKRDPQPVYTDLPKNKHELAARLLRTALANGDVESSEIKKIMTEYRIGEKTMQEVKTDLGIRSYRKMRKWYWTLSPQEE